MQLSIYVAAAAAAAVSAPSSCSLWRLARTDDDVVFSVESRGTKFLTSFRRWKVRISGHLFLLSSTGDISIDVTFKSSANVFARSTAEDGCFCAPDFLFASAYSRDSNLDEITFGD